MESWSMPKTIKGLRGLLGLTGYYRKFFKGYGSIARPLTDQLKKDAFAWSSEAQTAFVQLKHAMCSVPVLALPNFSEPFILEADASGAGLGVVLMKNGQPIAFYSQVLSSRASAKSVYERELMAIVLAIQNQKWWPYLLGRKFLVRTDQRSLKYLLEQRLKWLTKLLGYDFAIQYRSGLENKAAVALSRVHCEASLAAISIPNILSIPDLQAHVAANPMLAKVIKYLSLGQECGGFSLVQGCLKFRDLYWRGMRKDVQHFVAECAICHQHKYLTQSPTGLLQPLPVPEQVWEDISMDFIEGLPLSNGFDSILVVVDRLSKYGHFIPLRHPFSAVTVAMVFVREVVKLHGMPRSIVLDRDKIFISLFLKELFRLQGTQKMKIQADRKRRDVQYNVGDLVYVKLRPYRQPRSGPVASLQLPPESTIHPVFHVSLLRAALGPNQQATTFPPRLTAKLEWLLEPESVLEVGLGTPKEPPQALIKWKNLPALRPLGKNFRSSRTNFPISTLRTR
ncbi:uncharacterized protein LOC133796165 [Humulus lupulus]|uniref:uncharacterized protein LOC133796165 n=1 Tax=Humulus lupulus TaxID=3486 RepID=UPI002B40ECF6|nr:uncharacterized protein LOC133796165 [Humulus lupulus]